MRFGFVALLLVVAMAVPAHAATKSITAEDFAFSPARVAVAAGTTVTWVNGDGFAHDVVSKTGMFVSDTTQWPYTRTLSAGTFGYYCSVHGTSMSGTVRVEPRVAAAPDGRAFTVRWATSATNTGSKFTVQYRVNGGAWKTWRSASSGYSAVFGHNGVPVSVASGRTYGFRARSHRGGNASGFSPVRSFTP